MALISNTHYNFDTKHQAFNYQHEAFMAIKDKPYAAIFHEQGLGKTEMSNLSDFSTELEDASKGE